MTKMETRELADDQLTVLTQLEELLDDLANDRQVYDYQVREGVEAVETAQEHTVEMLDRASKRETDRVVLDLEEARRIANSLEMLYYDTKESAYDATDEQAATTEEVVAMTDEVGTISEETASSAENVAAAAEEQTATINEVTSGIESLSDQAGDLSELLQTFDVESETTHNAGTAHNDTDVYEHDATDVPANDD